MVQTELACQDDTLSLDTLIAMAIRLDNLLWKRRHPHRLSPSFVDHSESEPEPMEVGATRLPLRRQLGLCHYCDQEGHQLQRCPLRPNPGAIRAEGRPCDHPSPGVGVSIPSSLSTKPFLY